MLKKIDREELSRRIAEHADVFVRENYVNPKQSDYLVIKNAMILGGTIVLDSLCE